MLGKKPVLGKTPLRFLEESLFPADPTGALEHECLCRVCPTLQQGSWTPHQPLDIGHQIAVRHTPRHCLTRGSNHPGAILHWPRLLVSAAPAQHLQQVGLGPLNGQAGSRGIWAGSSLHSLTQQCLPGLWPWESHLASLSLIFLTQKRAPCCCLCLDHSPAGHHLAAPSYHCSVGSDSTSSRTSSLATLPKVATPYQPMVLLFNFFFFCFVEMEFIDQKLPTFNVHVFMSLDIGAHP